MRLDITRAWANRAGYQQNAGNNFMRLERWYRSRADPAQAGGRPHG